MLRPAHPNPVGAGGRFIGHLSGVFPPLLCALQEVALGKGPRHGGGGDGRGVHKCLFSHEPEQCVSVHSLCHPHAVRSVSDGDGVGMGPDFSSTARRAPPTEAAPKLGDCSPNPHRDQNSLSLVPFRGPPRYHLPGVQSSRGILLKTNPVVFFLTQRNGPYGAIPPPIHRHMAGAPSAMISAGRRRPNPRWASSCDIHRPKFSFPTLGSPYTRDGWSPGRAYTPSPQTTFPHAMHTNIFPPSPHPHGSSLPLTHHQTAPQHSAHPPAPPSPIPSRA